MRVMNELGVQNLFEYQKTEKVLLSDSTIVGVFAHIYESSLLGDFEPQSWHQFDLFWDHKDYQFFPKEKRQTIGLLAQVSAAAFVFKTDSFHIFETINMDLLSKLNDLERHKKFSTLKVFGDIMNLSNVENLDQLCMNLVEHWGV